MANTYLQIDLQAVFAVEYKDALISSLWHFKRQIKYDYIRQDI